MSVTNRGWFIVAALLLVAVLVPLALWGIWVHLLAGPAAISNDAPTPLASVTIPHRASSLAWSADGAYLAAGAWGLKQPNPGEPVPSEIVVVDIAKGTIATTLKTTGMISALIWSPDGKWLAVASQSTAEGGAPGAAPGELRVFDIPAFTEKFTVKADGPRKFQQGFIDLAWAPDNKSLYAIEDPGTDGETATLRRWAVPAFTEQPTIRAPQAYKYTALAVSPDGLTLAVADETGPQAKRMVRLFDLGKGTERSSFEVGRADVPPARLGFTPNGKAVGVFDFVTGDNAGGFYERKRLSWWDAETGRPASPDPARFAIQPAGLNYGGRGAHVISPDGRTQARGEEKHRLFSDIGGAFDGREKEFGAFVYLTTKASAKTSIWRIGKGDAPALAFSPDGTKLAGTVTQPSSEAIVIWAVPK